MFNEQIIFQMIIFLSIYVLQTQSDLNLILKIRIINLFQLNLTLTYKTLISLHFNDCFFSETLYTYLLLR